MQCQYVTTQIIGLLPFIQSGASCLVPTYYSSNIMVDTYTLQSRRNICTTYFMNFIPLRMVIDHIKIQNSC